MGCHRPKEHVFLSKNDEALVEYETTLAGYGRQVCCTVVNCVAPLSLSTTRHSTLCSTLSTRFSRSTYARHNHFKPLSTPLSTPHTLSPRHTPSVQNSPEIQKHLFPTTPFLATHPTPSLQHAVFKALSSTPKKSTKHSLPAILSLSTHSTNLSTTHTLTVSTTDPLCTTLDRNTKTLPLLQHSSSLYIPSLQQSPFYNTLLKKGKKRLFLPTTFLSIFTALSLSSAKKKRSLLNSVYTIHSRHH